MKYARQKRLLLALVAAASIVLQAAPARADTGLTVSPPLKEITLNSGLIQTSYDITLKNTSGATVNASYKLVDLKSLGQYGGNTLDKAGLPDSYNLASWMSLPNGDKQRIADGETATIKVNIDNREDLSPGGHYGAVIITTSPESAPKNTSINLDQQIISLVFVKKLGGEKYGLELESFKPNKSGVPDSVDLQFKSTGNVHVTPRGYVEVTDPEGKLVAKGIINPDSSIILPGASRKLVSIMQPVDNSTKSGQYKITVYYRYDGQEEFSAQQMYFNQSYSILNKIIVIILPLLLVLSGYLIWRKKRAKKVRK